jgi:3-oxoacyl-[acyl-carrier-protein] synthase II
MTKIRRVVVTGIGLVSSLGIGTEANWAGITAGQSGVGTITKFDATQFATRIAGEVKNFDPLAFIDKKMSRRWTSSFSTRSPHRSSRWTIPG